MKHTKFRVSYRAVFELMCALAPSSDRQENLMAELDMNSARDVDRICDEFLQQRLDEFNSFGMSLCKCSLWYFIEFEPSRIDDLLDIFQCPVNPPDEMGSFYRHVWARLFQAELPNDLSREDFYLDEPNMEELHSLLFGKISS